MKHSKLAKMALFLMTLLLLGACGGQAYVAGESGPIIVVSREEGSGTRDAFVEMTGVLNDGVDDTTIMASIVNSTDQVKTTVADDDLAISYISLGSMDDSVKALKINGVEPTEENVLSGAYPIARAFNIVYKDKSTLSDAAKDFIQFIHSKQGQDIVAEAKYVPLKSEPYTPNTNVSGTIKIAGSTSVGPVMEKLAEAYSAMNSNVTIDITQNGSGAGITAAEEGTAEIGMASRELKGEETKLVSSEPIAKDGIVVIVNNKNVLTNLSLDNVKKIFTGQAEDWSMIDHE